VIWTLPVFHPASVRCHRRPRSEIHSCNGCIGGRIARIGDRFPKPTRVHLGGDLLPLPPLLPPPLLPLLLLLLPLLLLLLLLHRLCDRVGYEDSSAVHADSLHHGLTVGKQRAFVGLTILGNPRPLTPV